MHVEIAINKLRYIIGHAKNSRLDRVLDKRNLHHRNLLSKLDSVKEEDVNGRVVEICNIVEGISNEDYDVAVAALMELSRLGYISATRGLSFAYYKFHGGHFVKGEEAMQVYKEAALSGEPLSAYVLGKIYEKKSEVLFDDRCAMALHWYMVAFDMDEISFMSDVALYKLLFKLGMTDAAIAKAKIIAELKPCFLQELYDQFDTYFVQREIYSAKRFLKIEGANPHAQSFSKSQELREKSAFSGKIYKAEEEDYFFSRSIDVVCSYSSFRIEGDHVIGYKQMIKGKLYALNIITHGIEHWVLACVDRTDTFHIFDGNAIVEGDTVGLPTDMQDLQDSLSGAYHGVVYHGYQIQHLVGVNSCAHVSYYMGQFLHEAIDFEQGEEVDLSGFSSSELFEKLRDFVVSGIGRDPVIQELHEKYVQRLYEDGGKTGASSVADSMSTMQEELTEQEQLDLAIQLSLNSSGANTTLEQEELTEQEQLDLAIQLSLNSSGANTTLEQEGLTEQEQLDLAIQLILRGSATLEQQSCTMLPSSTD